MSSIKNLLGQTAVYGLSTILSRMLYYLLTPLITNYYLPAEYGLYAEFFAYISFLNILFSFGMETSFFRFNQEEAFKPKLFTTLFYTLLISSIIGVLLLWLFSPIILNKLHLNSIPHFVHYMAGVLFFDTLCIIPFALLRLQNKMYFYSILKSLNIVISIIGTVFFMYIKPGNHCPIEYLFIATIISSFFTCLCLIPTIYKNISTAQFEMLKTILPYSLPILIIGFGGMVNETFDRILLNKLLPAGVNIKAEIGIYSVCYKIAIIITIFIQAFKMGAEPFFFNQSKDKDATIKYAQIMQIFTAFIFLIALGTLQYLNIIQYFIGKNFRSGMHIIPILLFANICLGIYYNLSIWYKLTNNTMLGGYITLIGAAITLIFDYLLIPVMGYVGAAWTTFICYFCMMVISYFWGQRHYKIPYKINTIVLQLFIVSIAYFIAIFLVKNVLTTFGFFEANSVLGFIINTVIFLLTAAILYKISIQDILKRK